jgi:hypothetical protein
MKASYDLGWSGWMPKNRAGRSQARPNLTAGWYGLRQWIPDARSSGANGVSKV